MTKLQELYETREKLQSLGIEPNADLERQLAVLEEEIIKNEIVPIITDTVEPVLKQVKRELVFVLEYHPEEGVHVQLSRKRSTIEQTNEKCTKESKSISYTRKENTSDSHAIRTKEKNDIFLQDKKVDWSFLNKGITLTNNCCNTLQNMKDWKMASGEKKYVKVLINNDCFDAALYFLNYDDRPNTIMQIRYTETAPIAIKLQKMFGENYRELERERLCKEKGIKYEKNSIDRYIHIYATATPYVFRFVVV